MNAVCALTDGVIGAAQQIKLEVVCFNLLRFLTFPQLFYPYDYTYVCPVSLLDWTLGDIRPVCSHFFDSPSDQNFAISQTEIISFSERNEEFTAINAQVLAISTDSHHTHLAWTRSKREDGGVGRLNIPLVADTSKKISASYGVLVTDESDDMFGAGKIDQEYLCCQRLIVVDKTSFWFRPMNCVYSAHQTC